MEQLLRGKALVLGNNIDTDQIIPARFLKATERKGFGDNLFRDWRYDAEGRPIAAFPLNDPRYEGQAYKWDFPICLYPLKSRPRGRIAHTSTG